MEQPTTTQHTHCLRCRRPLRSPSSVARGYGAHCAAKIRRAAADLADYKPHQITSARQLIADAAIIPLRRTLFLAVSTDGSAVHRTDARGHCSCPAGLRSARCFHTAAARMLLAA
ncbi:hypothetical protein GCM10010400_69940 [Streptomyces aculeolatus]|uniref:DUF6011 domain-containing protein n=1 Tax=Streptomyces aculeolatus TaxID=270689 RepID=UPI001CECB582|nr:DUF6011 domain-containing protein [Streptomyces aculeolatus]